MHHMKKNTQQEKKIVPTSNIELEKVLRRKSTVRFFKRSLAGLNHLLH